MTEYEHSFTINGYCVLCGALDEDVECRPGSRIGHTHKWEQIHAHGEYTAYACYRCGERIRTTTPNYEAGEH